MNDNLNNVEFINKKNDMQRSTVSIAVLLGIILFLLLIIGYLIYTNLKKADEIIIDNCKNETPIVENKKEEQEEDKPEEAVIVNDETIDTLTGLLPTIIGTEYIDYNLFAKKTLNKDDISSLKTTYELDKFKEVYYVPYQVEIMPKNTYLYIYVAIHDKETDTYYQSSLTNDSSITNPSFDPEDKEQLKEFGGRYKITYVNGAFGYLLEGIEFVNGKR